MAAVVGLGSWILYGLVAVLFPSLRERLDVWDRKARERSWSKQLLVAVVLGLSGALLSEWIRRSSPGAPEAD